MAFSDHVTVKLMMWWLISCCFVCYSGPHGVMPVVYLVSLSTQYLFAPGHRGHCTTKTQMRESKLAKE